MKDYELTCILDARLPQEKVDVIIDKLEKKISSSGGQIEKVDRWGNKKLPYTFQRFKEVKEGYYFMIRFRAGGDFNKELTRQLKMTEGVIRYLITIAPPVPPAPEKQEEVKIELPEVKSGES